MGRRVLAVPKQKTCRRGERRTKGCPLIRWIGLSGRPTIRVVTLVVTLSEYVHVQDMYTLRVSRTRTMVCLHVWRGVLYACVRTARVPRCAWNIMTPVSYYMCHVLLLPVMPNEPTMASRFDVAAQG